MPDLMCRYIDHYLCDKKDLGIFYKSNLSLTGIHSVISTCHRIEIISVIENIGLPNFEIGGYTSKQIYGIKNVCSRLAKIACGVDSVILGEPFVYDQVNNSFKYDKTDPLIFNTVKISLDIAKKVKKKYSFYSQDDYSDIAIKFLGSTTNVIIIGSGMLAKTLYDKLDNSLIISRNLKSARKKFERVSDIKNIPTKPFKCIIATTNTKKYQKFVTKALKNSNCLLAVDLSSKPFLVQPNFEYITMYDKKFEDEVKIINAKLISKVNLVKNDIDKQVNKIF